MGRIVVRTGTSPYTRGWVSAQPSVSEEAVEARRTKTPSPSGRLLLRMPPDLHGELAQAAEREGTSLNGYIIARLGESVGRRAANGSGPISLPSTTLARLLLVNVVTVALASAAAVVILLVAWLG